MGGREERLSIEELNDIFHFRDRILAAVDRYIKPVA
jgi:hypothetical protein